MPKKTLPSQLKKPDLNYFVRLKRQEVFGNSEKLSIWAHISVLSYHTGGIFERTIGKKFSSRCSFRHIFLFPSKAGDISLGLQQFTNHSHMVTEGLPSGDEIVCEGFLCTPNGDCTAYFILTEFPSKKIQIWSANKLVRGSVTAMDQFFIDCYSVICSYNSLSLVSDFPYLLTVHVRMSRCVIKAFLMRYMVSIVFISWKKCRFTRLWFHMYKNISELRIVSLYKGTNNTWEAVDTFVRTYNSLWSFTYRFMKCCVKYILYKLMSFTFNC